MWNEYITATSIDETVRILTERGERARIVAGATDLMLELERGLRPSIETLIDISRIADLDRITLDEAEVIHLGPLVTHNHCAASKLLRERAYPLARAAWEVGAPQIRNRGTVAGNLITASPANDTITPLMALDAWVTLKSSGGERKVPLSKFYTGVRKTIMQADEMLVDIAFQAMKEDQHGAFMKLALRRAQAISVVNVALILTLNRLHVKSAVITLGAVAPTIVHAPEAEEYLAGKELTAAVIAQAAGLAAQAARPIDDIRGSAAYRREMVRVLTLRGLRAITDSEARAEPCRERSRRAGRGEQAGPPSDPVLLWGKTSHVDTSHVSTSHVSTSHVTRLTSHVSRLMSPIHTKINGKVYTFTSGYDKSLLRLLREEAGLTGTKEGCAEGECGACTVYLDGKAVMACLVPAPRAHGAEIVTVEGLADLTLRQAQGEAPGPFPKDGRRGRLHPVQRAFIEDGAVQCGYCTPGFLMSAAKLLEEKPHPSRGEIAQAITGNLCRCTGYYKIVKAIEDASAGEV